MARYENPFGYGPAAYETHARPIEHAGCLIYQRIKGCVWDVVRDGVCIAQRAGPRGAREAAERYGREAKG